MSEGVGGAISSRRVPSVLRMQPLQVMTIIEIPHPGLVVLG